ncbi:hypothetical protein LMH73_008770 [Vibrio splendidus]|nr:hypothetical protein [Vibrio splendidus]MCC4879440.1 hypothetical protein [Vibrio splendidus]
MNVFIQSDFGSKQNGIKITAPEGSSPDKFRFHMSKVQGDSEEKGMTGYVNMLAIRDSIINTIAYMNENHKDFLIQAMMEINKVKVEQDSPKTLFPHGDDKEMSFFHSETAVNVSQDMSACDQVTISHASRASMARIPDESGNVVRKMIPATRDLENTEIKIRKWQGDSENGQEGMMRLLALQTAIERCACSMNLTFGMHKEAEKIMGINQEKTNDSSLSR